MGEPESGSWVWNCNEVVVALLTTKKDFRVWSQCVRNYLVARDLWKVVDYWGYARPPEDEDHKEDFMRWRRMNDAALRAIQISCSPEALSHIRGVSEAKDAWQILNWKYNPAVSYTQGESEQVELDALLLRKAICDNKWGDAKAILDRHPSAVAAELDSAGQICIHFAARLGRVDIVEELVRLVPPYLLEVVDNFGSTPLESAAYTGSVRIAECLIQRNSRLPTLLLHPTDLPTITAFSRGHKAFGRYLYSLTPLESLKPQSGTYGVDLLYWCFFAGALDVALDLLQRCPQLLFTRNRFSWHPIKGIAAKTSAFSRGRELVFWKRWIYNC